MSAVIFAKQLKELTKKYGDSGVVFSIDGNVFHIRDVVLKEEYIILSYEKGEFPGVVSDDDILSASALSERILETAPDETYHLALRVPFVLQEQKLFLPTGIQVSLKNMGTQASLYQILTDRNFIFEEGSKC